jgi:hypothetical protein
MTGTPYLVDRNVLIFAEQFHRDSGQHEAEPDEEE